MNKFIDYPYHRTHDYHVEKLLNIVQEKQRAFVYHEWDEHHRYKYDHIAGLGIKRLVFQEDEGAVLAI